MGKLCSLYKEVIGNSPAVNILPPPPFRQPVNITTELPGVTKQRSAACALRQTANALLHEEHTNHIHVYVDGSVNPTTGSSTAACIIPAENISKTCRLPPYASSTAAETAGLHLAVDLLAENLPSRPVAIYCDSKAALLGLQQPERSTMGTALLTTRLAVLQEAGCPYLYTGFHPMSAYQETKLQIEEETLEHLLLSCLAHSLHRLDMLRAYRNLGLPCATQEHVLFPGCHQESAFRSLLGFLDASGLSSSL
ncbi:hypothetical protein HPB50_026575 [Hyalomma asiaticum]|uniref:Uncharacterized protein n=1 Tax=Hyalomma asiaticum TaxID=266040 RepID=A0ACB7TRN9_HYAAI|nr:hypothetical protein HPB50_026575 [Hyalomma asiaticum]